MLEVKDLHCSYGTTQVLKGVDLNVNKGEVISILGSSGSGKTTLLRCISFLQKADSGTIRFDDFEKDITQLKHSEIRALRMKMGYVFQNFNLFRNMTVKQNVLEGLITARGVDRAAADKTADEVLEKVGMLHRKDFYPDQLSGGQQQRVALARILASEPQAILLDEPFSALDSYLKWELELELGELLGAFDGPILWVSHELGGSGTPFRILRIIPDAGHAILLLQPEGAAEGSPVLRAECEAAGTYAAGQMLPVSFREEKLLFF